jgi:Nuclease-related domain
VVADVAKLSAPMASARPWPFDDDDDRPSGSVRPLSQADLQAILAHLNNDLDGLVAGIAADRPVDAIRVPASVGRPGGSAQARWRRMWAAEWATWTRTLPWRVVAALGLAAAGGLLGSLLASRLSLVLGTLAAVAAGVGLRFRPSPDAIAWRRGAAGERRTARLLGPLERYGWVVLHDLALSGSQANLDHLVIGPGGVFVVDSNTVSGPAAARRVQEAVAWPLCPCFHLAGGVLGGRPGRPGPARPRRGRGALVAVHGVQVPWGKVVVDGVRVVTARRLPSRLRQLPVVLRPERVTGLADQARSRFHAAR